MQIYLFFLASMAWMLKAGAAFFSLGAGLGFFVLGGAMARCLRRLRATLLLPSVSLGIGVDVSQSSESDDDEDES